MLLFLLALDLEAEKLQAAVGGALCLDDLIFPLFLGDGLDLDDALVNLFWSIAGTELEHW